MVEKIKNAKILLLQNIYNDLTKIIINFEKHLKYLYDIFLIDYTFKQNIINQLNNLGQNINTNYNSYIVEKLDMGTELDEWININLENNINIENINTFINFMNIDDVPLFKPKTELIKLIGSLGYSSLKGILKIFIGKKYKLYFSKEVNKTIKELNKIFVPVSFEFFTVNKTEDIYWRNPLNYDENDLLKIKRELWIKYNDKYIKISGIFKNDNLGLFFKTSQINFSVYYKLKQNIERDKKDFSINAVFLKKFMQYNYIGNIYSLSSIDYLKNCEKYYQKYLELSTSTFLTVMKEFISESECFKNMFDIIFILLLGTEDNINIAVLLLNLLKEKKETAQSIFNLINSHLHFNLQSKLKKSNLTIKQELAKLNTLSSENVDYKKQLILNKNIPLNAKTTTLEKIQEMKLFNNEYYKQFSYVKHILNFPWTSPSDDVFYQTLKSNSKNVISYLANVENELRKSSFGHEEAKNSLLQIIGKWISNPSSQGSCFGLVGPPGVGKTLLAKSVSKALNIPFAQITLGGQNDGELLHGHGYTYSGSQPGMIIKKMVEAGKSRCILYFDELDKATSKHGTINEITSILIHLTDSNMNKSFQDRFFQGIDFPLDKVIMIFSYNDSSLVDPILLDRIKEIKIKPYTTNEKMKIVKNFIIPELTESIGLQNEKWINLSDDIVEYIIDNYTNEAGVRDIKRYIEKLFLILNLDKLYKRNLFKNKKEIVVNKKIINKLLENPNNDFVKIHPKSSIGIINGLYATTNGDGGIIPIQIFNNYASAPNLYEIKLTGSQGDVMKESVHCSLTVAIDYIRRNLSKYPFIKDLNTHLLENFKYGFHIHAPSTSTPKDGPSAGGAFTSAFISRILGKPIRNDISMTGEIELTGKITKIGGLNFKLIGAKKAGIKLVFVPKENEKDLEEIKEKYSKLFDADFEVKYFDYIDEIMDIILL
jgi:endopeptidase La